MNTPNLLELFHSGFNPQQHPHPSHIATHVMGVNADPTIVTDRDLLGDCVPEPSDLQINVMVCQVSLGCQVNLDLIARQLPSNHERIVGLKLAGVNQWGKIKVKSAKSLAYAEKKNEDRHRGHHVTRADFSNQCTLIVSLPEHGREPNFKLFPNGKGVITGVHSPEEANLVTQIVQTAIVSLRGDYQIRPTWLPTETFASVSEYVDFVSKNYLVLLKLFAIFGVDLQLNLDLILNAKKKMAKYQATDDHTGLPVEKNLLDDYTLTNLIEKRIIVSGDDEALQRYYRLIQVFGICHHYLVNEQLLVALDDDQHYIQQVIRDLYQFQVLNLPVTYDLPQLQIPRLATTDNYNVMFRTNFRLDRARLAQVLNERHLDQLESAKFEPTKYPGVNVKYISRLNCHNLNNCQSKGKKKNKICGCKSVSFLMFQEGEVMITGAETWPQVLEGYQLITLILKSEYQHISLTPQAGHLTTTYQPPEITLGESGDIYLNRQQFIFNHPANYCALKLAGLLDHYLPPELKEELSP